MKSVLAILLVLPALAGCIDSAKDPSSFDGVATFDWVEEIVYDEDGELRPRTPGNVEGHAETAIWLAEQMDVEGWTVRADGFDGEQFSELDKGAVSGYDSPRYCNENDRAELESMQFTNLYATKSAADATGHVVLAAHWDAKEDSKSGAGPIPAANDGASGMAVLLQLQRHLNELNADLPFDLTIAFFDGEDGFNDCHPLAGSLWAARNESMGEISQLILLDMVGDENARFIRETYSTQSDPSLVDEIWNHAAEVGLGDNFVSKAAQISDDHVPFIEEGIAAVDIIDAGHGFATFQPYWHTMEDTPDKLSSDMLCAIGELVLWILTDPETQVLLQD